MRTEIIVTFAPFEFLVVVHALEVLLDHHAGRVEDLDLARDMLAALSQLRPPTYGQSEQKSAGTPGR